MSGDGVSARQIHRGERTDAEPEALPRDPVDFLRGAEPFFHSERRGLKETFENRIDRIAVAARDADGNFADGFIKRKKPFDDRAIGFVRGYDFDERIALRGEKVSA